MFILPLCCTVKQQNIICGCGISNGSQFLCSTSSTQVRSWRRGSTATHTLAGSVGVQLQLLEVPLCRNVIVDGTDSTTQQSYQSSTDSTDMSEKEQGSDTSHDEVSKETLIDETAQFTENFTLEESSYHEDCQKALRKCKELQLQKENINLRVTPEPTNIRDKNAVIVEAYINSDW